MSGIVLRGIDGSNPLGLLAALGLLDVVTQQEPGARLSWRDEGAWRPVLLGAGEDRGRLLGLVMEDAASWRGEPVLALSYPKEGKESGKEGNGKADREQRDLKPTPSRMAEYLRGLATAAAPDARRGVDMAAALASDVIRDESGVKVKPTALHFTAGQQQFLRMVNELREGLVASDIEEALFGPWRYQRTLPVMGWDATSARDYALRARNPAKEEKAGVPGVDWLAVVGLSFLPVAPSAGRLYTTGCHGSWKSGKFRWPLWSVPLGRDAARVLLGLDGLPDLSEENRRRRGIAAVFECSIRRSEQGGYGSFSPPTAL